MSFVDPFKTTGWNQDLYAQSATKKESYGTLRFTKDGRAFRYGKAGEALTAGKATSLAEGTANHTVETGDVVALGATLVTLLLGATAAAENLYADGYLQVYDGEATVVGHQYLVVSHPATGSAEDIILTLDRPIVAAWISTDTWALIPNPWSSLTHEASLVHGFGGVPVISVTSGYYAWFQVGGVACGLNGGNTALGSVMVPSGTEGAFKTMAAYDGGVVGQCIGYTGVNTKYCPILLTAAI